MLKTKEARSMMQEIRKEKIISREGAKNAEKNIKAQLQTNIQKKEKVRIMG